MAVRPPRGGDAESDSDSREGDPVLQDDPCYARMDNQVRGGEQLVAADIGETKNMIEDETERAASMQAAWDKWNESNVPPKWGDGRGGRRRTR